LSGGAPSPVSKSRRILIVGAGIGGLTAALALSRRGFEVEIAERAEELSEVGAGIQISANAGRVLAELGLDSAVAEVATEPAALEVRSGPTDGLLTSVSREKLRQRYGFPYRVLHRADLQGVLRRAVGDAVGIRLDLAREVTGMTADEGVGQIRSVGPAESHDRSYDIVVGADGVRSSLRRLIGGPPARPAGRTAWRALIPVEAARDFMRADAVTAWLGPRAHLVCYPVSRGAQVNIVAIVEEETDAPGWGLPGEPADLIARYAAWSARLRALLAVPTSWKKYSLMTVDAGGAWAKGRVALLGDAAHAMTPFLAQGAVMAIEDAAVLARSLATIGDVPAALQAYAKERRQRVMRVAAAAARTGERYHFTGSMAAARDLALRVAGEALVLNEVDWIYRWQPSGG
jgi:salicylate hydroxylase